MSDLVLLERRDDGVAVVTLDNPKVNALSKALLAELEAVAQGLIAEPPGAVVVTGGDRLFAAGAEISEFWAGEAPISRDEVLTLGDGFYRALNAVAAIPRITIAAISGFALGGGCELALACDLRIASEKAKLGQPEVLLGIIPGGGGTQRLPRLMGRGRALEAVLACADFDAETAERYGWVNRALPPGELAPFVEGLARRIASFPPDAVRRAKAAVDAATGAITDGLLEEAYHFNRTLADPELDARIEGALALGAQTREGELDLTRLLEP